MPAARIVHGENHLAIAEVGQRVQPPRISARSADGRCCRLSRSQRCIEALIEEKRALGRDKDLGVVSSSKPCCVPPCPWEFVAERNRWTTKLGSTNSMQTIRLAGLWAGKLNPNPTPATTGPYAAAASARAVGTVRQAEDRGPSRAPFSWWTPPRQIAASRRDRFLRQQDRAQRACRAQAEARIASTSPPWFRASARAV